MPSLRHQALAYVVPRLRGSVPLDSAERERARLEACQAEADRSLPTRGIRRFAHRYEVTTTDAPFPVHVIRPRGRRPRTTVYYLHGGGYVAPADPLHTKYALRLAAELDAEERSKKEKQQVRTTARGRGRGREGSPVSLLLPVHHN